MNITVMGRRVRVLYKKPPTEDADQLLGYFDSRKMTIWISPDQTKDEQYASLIHELLHCILFMSGTNQLLDEKGEEAVVRALEHGLVPLLPTLRKIK